MNEEIKAEMEYLKTKIIGTIIGNFGVGAFCLKKETIVKMLEEDIKSSIEEVVELVKSGREGDV